MVPAVRILARIHVHRWKASVDAAARVRRQRTSVGRPATTVALALDTRPTTNGRGVHGGHLESVNMSTLDGHYRHQGTTLAWDSQGLTLRPCDREELTIAWSSVYVARRIRAAGDLVEVLFDAAPESPDAALESFSLPVSTHADADRLLTIINWRAGPRAGS